MHFSCMRITVRFFLVASGLFTTLSQSFSQCIDSDGGSQRYIFGKVQNTVDGVVTELADSCSDSNTVVEQRCDANGPSNEIIVCAHGCQEGACITANAVDGQWVPNTAPSCALRVIVTENGQNYLSVNSVSPAPQATPLIRKWSPGQPARGVVETWIRSQPGMGDAMWTQHAVHTRRAILPEVFNLQSPPVAAGLRPTASYEILIPTHQYLTSLKIKIGATNVNYPLQPAQIACAPLGCVAKDVTLDPLVKSCCPGLTLVPSRFNIDTYACVAVGDGSCGAHESYSYSPGDCR
jgi:hypothetical protein